ncbi:MAG: PAS domain S-box protein [Solirubrobacteraceae bacterium]
MTTRSARKDGTDLYADLSFALVKSEAGEVLGAVAVARDITARHMAYRESRNASRSWRQESKLCHLADDSGEGGLWLVAPVSRRSVTRGR